MLTQFSTRMGELNSLMPDVLVAPPYRRLDLSQSLLHHAEAIARRLDCCKLTLEVLEGNQVAQSAYTKFGFRGYRLEPQMGMALFWEKQLG